MTTPVRTSSFAQWYALAALAVLCVVGPAWGATADRTPQPIAPRTSGARPTTETRPASRGSSSNSGLWTSAGALTLVVVLILVTARVVRKGMPQARGVLPTEVLQVLGRRLVDYRNSICLVRCGSRLLVLGSSQAGLVTLAEITDPVEVDLLSGLCTPTETGAAGTFGRLISRMTGQGVPIGGPDAEPLDKDAAVLRLKERLAISPAGNAAADEHLSQEVA